MSNRVFPGDWVESTVTKRRGLLRDILPDGTAIFLIRYDQKDIEHREPFENFIRIPPPKFTHWCKAPIWYDSDLPTSSAKEVEKPKKKSGGVRKKPEETSGGVRVSKKREVRYKRR